MRPFVRSAGIAVIAFIAAVLLAVTTTFTSVALAATALIMGGTGHPLSVDKDTPAFISSYVDGANSNYIAPSGLCTSGGGPGNCQQYFAVYTPEQFRFDTGFFDMTFDQSVAAGRANLDGCIRSGVCRATAGPGYTVTDPNQNVSDTTYVVYGYSQSAVVATAEKRDLIANPPASSPDVFFVLAANPNKPNGGILERFQGLYIPILGVTFNGATPTNNPDGTPTDMTTVDVTRQYDGWSDFPTNPLFLLSDLNAAMGIALLHGNYFGVGTPQLQGQYGDTTYYMIATPVVPLLMPIDQIPLIGHPLAVTLDPFFRVLIEAGYDRTINPGQPTPAKWLYIPNPIKLIGNLVGAVPTGLDNGIAAISGDPATRPFGTTEPGPYGVGGPPVDAGCGGGANCGNPTPYVAVNSAPEIAAAKFAPTPSPSEQKPNDAGEAPVDAPQDPKPGDDTQVVDSQTVTPPAGNETTPQKPDKPSIMKFDVFSVPQLPKKPAQPDVRKPAEPKFPRLRDLVPSLPNPFNKPKPAAATDGTPAAGSSDTPASTGDSTPAGATK